MISESKWTFVPIPQGVPELCICIVNHVCMELKNISMLFKQFYAQTFCYKSGFHKQYLHFSVKSFILESVVSKKITFFHLFLLAEHRSTYAVFEVASSCLGTRQFIPWGSSPASCQWVCDWGCYEQPTDWPSWTAPSYPWDKSAQKSNTGQSAKKSKDQTNKHDSQSYSISTGCGLGSFKSSWGPAESNRHRLWDELLEMLLFKLSFFLFSSLIRTFNFLKENDRCGGYLSYLPVVAMVRRLDVFLDEVRLHGNEKVTCCAVGCFHLPHEVLHTELCTQSGIFNKESLKPTSLTHNCSSSSFLPLVRSCSLYIWQMEALWFSNWLTLCSVFWNLFCKYSYKKIFISLQIIHVWLQWTCRDSQPLRRLSASPHQYGFSWHVYICAGS